MSAVLHSNDDLENLRIVPKMVTNPGARWKEKPGCHRQRSFIAEAGDGSRHRACLRQNSDDDKDFPFGHALIRWVEGLSSSFDTMEPATGTGTSDIAAMFTARPRKPWRREGKPTAWRKKQINTEPWAAHLPA